MLGGRRVAKDDARIEAYGTVDELSVISGLGPRRRTVIGPDFPDPGGSSDLFTARGGVGTPPRLESSADAIRQDQVQQLEATIDEHEEGLEPLRNFILPGGSWQRAFCIRLESSVGELNGEW